MKMTKEHLLKLKEGVLYLLKKNKISSVDIKTPRQRIQVLNATGIITNAEEFHYLNDSNIDTAMIKILKEI